MARPFKNKFTRKSAGSPLSFKFFGGLRKFFFISLPYLFSLLIAGGLFGTVLAYAMNSPVFQLQEVKILNNGTMTPEQSFKFCELQKGENLITLDIINVQQVIKRSHPEFKEVVVHRVLPNRVEVALKRRTPAAQVKYSRYIQIDSPRIAYRIGSARDGRARSDLQQRNRYRKPYSRYFENS